MWTPSFIFSPLFFSVNITQIFSPELFPQSYGRSAISSLEITCFPLRPWRVLKSLRWLTIINWFPKKKITHFKEFECPFKRNVCPLSTIHKAFNYGARLLLLVDAAPAPGQLGRLASPSIQYQEDRRNLRSLPRPNSSNPRCSKIGRSITPSSGTLLKSNKQWSNWPYSIRFFQIYKLLT
jgi:hypothetical protein